MTQYVFIRHGECHKNLEGVTGGTGTSLTGPGADQVKLVAAEMAGRFSHPKIVACPTIQTIETAAIIAMELGCDYTVDESLLPAGLGVVGGLRQKDIECLYPDHAQQLRRWRKFEIEACELRIPGIEPPADFWSRTIAVLRGYEGNDEIVVVATRSIMVLAANLSMDRTPEPGGGYKHVNIGYCQTVTVNL